MASATCCGLGGHSPSPLHQIPLKLHLLFVARIRVPLAPLDVPGRGGGVRVGGVARATLWLPFPAFRQVSHSGSQMDLHPCGCGSAVVPFGLTRRLGFYHFAFSEPAFFPALDVGRPLLQLSSVSGGAYLRRESATWAAAAPLPLAPLHGVVALHLAWASRLLRTHD